MSKQWNLSTRKLITKKYNLTNCGWRGYEREEKEGERGG